MKTCWQAIALLFTLFCWQQAGARDLKPIQQPTSLSFIANAGQITDQAYNLRMDIDYKLNAAGMDIFIGDGQIHYQWTKQLKPAASEVPTVEKGSNDSEIEIYRMDVELVGANKKAKVIAEEPQGYYERYYTAHTGVEGVTAHSYQKITYQNVYPNIDWVLYVRDNQLKYDFVVHPGGDPKDIKLKYEGADELSLKDGALTAVTPFGSITEQAPYSYETGSRREVITSYVVRDDVLSFAVAHYENTLIIDPVLIWGTYFGNNSGTEGLRCSTDPTGNVYMGGATNGTANITTAGSHQMVFGGANDGYIVKFSSTGTQLWCTYYGGSDIDRIIDIKCESSGTVYIGGYTRSAAGIATPGSHQPIYASLNNTDDVFLAKFDGTGQRLWGTYYGGAGYETFGAVAIDNAGNVYLSGSTNSTNNIATPGSHQPALASAGYGDAFLAKFNSAGTRLWGTYYGGADADQACSAVCDGSGAVYISGLALSMSGIATPGAYQVSKNLSSDAFLAKFSATGSLVWGTYFGGPGQDFYSAYTSSNLAYDPSGYIYLPGITQSTSGIATPGSHQPVYGGGPWDAYLTKFNLNGALQWSTYFGGPGEEYEVQSFVSPLGILYLCGTTSSTSGITTPGTYQPVAAGAKDAYIARFTAAGQQIEGTYYGGAGDDYMQGMGFFGFSDVYLCGTTTSVTGIATPGSFQPTLMYMPGNGFLAKFIEDTSVYIMPPFNDTVLCKGQVLPVPYGTVHSFNTGNIFTVQLSNASGSFASPVNVGTLAATTTGTITCIIPTGTPSGAGYRIRIVSTNPVRTSADNGINIAIQGGPAVIASSNSPVCAGATLNLNANTLAGVTYSWTGPVSYTANTQNPTRTNLTTAMAGWYVVTANNGTCTGKDSVNVTVNSVLNATIGGTGACMGGTLNLTASTTSPGATYSWNGPNSFTSNQQNPTINGVTAAAAGTYTVVITGSGCSTTLTTNVTIGTPPNAPSAGSNTPVCAGQNINLSSLSTTPGVSYSWTGPGSYTSTQQSPTRTNATVAMSGTYNVVAMLNGCSSTATATTVVVNPAPAAPTASNNGPLCAGVALDLFATGVPGATYSWNGPGSYASNAQNPTILNASTANAGTYNVTQTVGGCTSPAASTTVVINNSVNPTINIFPNPNDSVCSGTPVTFVSVATNGGTTPQYQWYKNGNPIGGATNTTYNTSSFNSGDYFSCQLTSNAFCAVPATKMSNNVTLTLIPPAPAQINITANPGLVLSPWELVTFTATSVMGGIAPSYQWYRNGQKVIGATSTTWNANNLNNLDTISVVLLSSDPCAVPNTDTSNRLVVNIKTGISKMDHDNNIVLYPNPNNGDFIVKGDINAKEVSIEILNAIGQRVYSNQLPVHNAQLNEPIHIDAAAGIYLLKLKTNTQTQTLRFTLH